MESLTKDQLEYIERHGSSKNPKTIARDLKLELRHVQNALKGLRDPKRAPAAPPERSLLDPAPLLVAPRPQRSLSLVLIVAAVVVILALGAIAYSNNGACGWHFDDSHTITANNAVHTPTVSAIYKNNIYRQVLYWSFAFSWWRNAAIDPKSGNVVGQDIAGWHLENNAIHLANGLLVFWLALLTLRSPGGRAQSRWPVLVAGLAGAIFVLHPLQTQAVTYITQRTESLCTTFYLLALGLYAWARLRRADGRAIASVETPALCFAGAVAIVVLAAAKFGSPSGPQLKPFLVVTALAGAGAIGSIAYLIVKHRADPIEVLLLGGSLAVSAVAMETKEIAGTIPAAMILWEVLFGVPRATTKPANLLERLRPHAAVAPYAAMLVFLPVLAVAMDLSLRLFFKEGVEAVSDIHETTGLQYVLTEINVLSTYVRLYLLPYRQALDYDYPIRSTLLDGPTLFSLAALGGALWAAIKGYRRWPVITWSVLLGLGVLAPTSIMVLPDVIFEHRVYLPLAGAALLTALLLERVLRHFIKNDALAMKAFVGASVPILAVLLVLTHYRNQVWIDDPTLWSDSAVKFPTKARPLTDIGIAYANLEPYRFVLKNGQVWGGDYIDCDAFPSGSPGCIMILPTFVNMNPNLPAKLLVAKSEIVEGPTPWGGQLAAEKVYEAALKLDPDYYKARNNLALCEVQIGTLRLERAQDVRTVEEMKKVAAPDDQRLRDGVDRLKAIELEAFDHFKKAEGHFQRILANHPTDYVALNNLGNLYFQYLDRVDDAIDSIEASIKLNQSQPIIFAVAGEAYYARANDDADKNKTRESMRDYEKAVEYYQRFLELSADNQNFEHIRVRLQKAQQGVKLGVRVAQQVPQGPVGNPFKPVGGSNVGNLPRWKPPK